MYYHYIVWLGVSVYEYIVPTKSYTTRYSGRTSLLELTVCHATSSVHMLTSRIPIARSRILLGILSMLNIIQKI